MNTGQGFYLPDGWGALHGSVIFSPSQVALPISPETLIQACQSRWPGRTQVFPAEVGFTEVSVGVAPDNEYTFTISLYEGSMLMGSDGTSEQNIRLAAWLRSLMPSDAPRIVVADDGLNVHAELPHGVTPEQIAATMVSHSIEGWDAGDHEWQRLWTGEN